MRESKVQEEATGRVLQPRAPAGLTINQRPAPPARHVQEQYFKVPGLSLEPLCSILGTLSAEALDTGEQREATPAVSAQIFNPQTL